MSSRYLTEFLLARFAVDEARARAATQGRWVWSASDGRSLNAHQGDEWRPCPYYCAWSSDSDLHRGEQGKPGHEHRVVEPVVYAGGYEDPEVVVEPPNAEHIGRWQPARVLAECETKRRIIRSMDANAGRVVVRRQMITREMRNYILQLMALPYADHPDYLEEWKA